MSTGDEDFKVRKKTLMDIHPNEIYGRMRNLYFCLKIFHGGRFVRTENLEYTGGSVDILDMVEPKDLAVCTLNKMVVFLGKGKYSTDERLFCHFHVPGKGLEDGLELIDGPDCGDYMCTFLDDNKCLVIYVEHGTSLLCCDLEGSIGGELTPVKGVPVVSIVSPEYNRDRRRNCSRKVLQFTPLVNIESGDDSGCDEYMHASHYNGDVKGEAPNRLSQLVDVVIIDGTNPLSDEDSDYVPVEDEGCTNEVDRFFFENNIDPNVEWYDKSQKGDTGGGVGEDEEEPLTICQDELYSGDEDDCMEVDGGSNRRNAKRQRNPQFNKKRDMVKPKFLVSQEFASKQEIRAAILQHSIDTRRELKIVKNDKSRIRAICEGNVPGNGDTGIKIDEGIMQKDLKESQRPWTLHASRLNDGTWQIKTLVEEHWCIQSRTIKAVTSKFLARELTETIKRNPEVPINALREDLEEKYQVNVSRMKAFRAKMTAHDLVIGTYKEQYSYLRDYYNEIVRTHPGTTMKIDVEPCGNPSSNIRIFRRLYCCLGPLKAGFKSACRPVLGLDGTFMKGPFPGQLLSAVALDSNNGIYPVAYAMVEAENMKSWTWFLTNLGDDLDIEKDSHFCFMSDRQKGLIPALAKKFPAAEHRYCLKHIWENMKLSFKGLVYKDLLWSAATASNIPYFEKAMEELKKVDPKAWEWLKEIPPASWSKSHFSLFPKIDILYNNLCETFNSKVVKGRDKPIITCLEFVRMYIMKRITTVQKEIAKCKGLLCPSVQLSLEETKKLAESYRSCWNGGHRYQVSGPFGDQCIVDLEYKSCSCRRWDLSAIPCKHAVRAI